MLRLCICVPVYLCACVLVILQAVIPPALLCHPIGVTACTKRIIAAGTKLDDARNECQQRLVATLKEFRIIQAQVSRAAGGMHNQLLYPDTLKFLPVWTLGTC